MVKALGFLLLAPLIGAQPANDAEKTVNERELPPGAYQFTTDFSIKSVDYGTVISGGPPKDGIPAIDDPQYDTLDQAREWLDPDEAVLVLNRGNGVRLYPLQILMFHEIVNEPDAVVTYCPLCSTGIAFDPRVDGRVLDFGTTGLLRFSNLIMYDRQTESWWQQASGTAIAGTYTGLELDRLPMERMSFKQAAENYPTARVLGRNTGFDRGYGRNPYVGYDDPQSRPFLYDGPDPSGNLSLMERVIEIRLGGQSTAVSFDQVRNEGLVQTSIGGRGLILVWTEGALSPLDRSLVAEGRTIGSVNVYWAAIEGREGSFSQTSNGELVDEVSGRRFNRFGKGVGEEADYPDLELVPSVEHFWFSAYSLTDAQLSSPSSEP